MTEPRLRTIVAAGQWTVSLALVAALVAVTLGGAWWAWAVGAWVGCWLVLALALLVRMGPPRAWAAVVLEAFIVGAGIALIHYLLATAEASGTAATLNRIHSSADFLTTAAQAATVQHTLDTLNSRLATLPADWATRATDLIREIKDQQGALTALTGHLASLEASAANAPAVTAVSAFSLFGLPAGTTASAFLAVLGIGNELSALLLAWGSATRNATTTATTSVPPPAPTVEAYVEAARRLSPDGRRPAGYRVVGLALGLSERAARGLLAEAIELGLIVRK